MTKYIYHSENGKTTCKDCKKNDGKVFYDIKDIPKLPVHPNCRCWIETVEDNSTNSVCDCANRIDVAFNMAQNSVLGFRELFNNTKKEIYELEIIKEQNFNRLNELDSAHKYLKGELGLHQKTCFNYVDEIFKNISSDIAYIKEYSNKIPKILNSLVELKNYVDRCHNLARNTYIDINLLKETKDITYHTINECKSLDTLRSIENKINALSVTLSDNSLKLRELKDKIKEIQDNLKDMKKHLDEVKKKNAQRKACGCIKEEAEEENKEKLLEFASHASLFFPIAATCLDDAMNDFKEARKNPNAEVCDSTQDITDENLKKEVANIAPANSKGVMYDSKADFSKKLFDTKEIQEFISKNYDDLINNKQKTQYNIEFKGNKNSKDAYYSLQHCILLNPKIVEGKFSATIIDYYDFEYRNGKGTAIDLNNQGYMAQEKGRLENYFLVFDLHGKVDKKIMKK